MLFVVLEGDRPLARGARSPCGGRYRLARPRGRAGRDAKCRRTHPRSARSRAMDFLQPRRAPRRRRGVDRRGCGLAQRHVRQRSAGHEPRAPRGGRARSGARLFRVPGHPRRPTARWFATLTPGRAEPFGLQTLLPELEESHAALVARRAKEHCPHPAPRAHRLRQGGARARGARAIASNRPLHCSELRRAPAALVESLLFGHVKGAFSGAARDELGFVRSADGGRSSWTRSAICPQRRRPRSFAYCRSTRSSPSGRPAP